MKKNWSDHHSEVLSDDEYRSHSVPISTVTAADWALVSDTANKRVHPHLLSYLDSQLLLVFISPERSPYRLQHRDAVRIRRDSLL